MTEPLKGKRRRGELEIIPGAPMGSRIHNLYEEKDVRAAVEWLLSEINSHGALENRPEDSKAAEAYNEAMTWCLKKAKEAFPDILDKEGVFLKAVK